MTDAKQRSPFMTPNLMPFQLKRRVVKGTFHARRSPRSGHIGEITSLELAQ